jgi:hypothetical protein
VILLGALKFDLHNLIKCDISFVKLIGDIKEEHPLLSILQTLSSLRTIYFSMNVVEFMEKKQTGFSLK